MLQAEPVVPEQRCVEEALTNYLCPPNLPFHSSHAALNTGEEENGSVGFREALISNYESWLEGTQVRGVECLK